MYQQGPSACELDLVSDYPDQRDLSSEHSTGPTCIPMHFSLPSVSQARCLCLQAICADNPKCPEYHCQIHNGSPGEEEGGFLILEDSDTSVLTAAGRDLTGADYPDEWYASVWIKRTANGDHQYFTLKG